MVNFDTQTMTVNDKTLIQNGTPVNGYVLTDEQVTLNKIEQLFAVYETSFPDKKEPSLFPAKSEQELSMNDIVYAPDRSYAKQELEQTLFIGIINKSLTYPNMQNWFWQSDKNKNLVIPRWLFTQECHRSIAFCQNHSQENELWDRNLAGRRLRYILNTSACKNTGNMTMKDCFFAIKEELSEHDTEKIFTDQIIDQLLAYYFDNLPKRLHKRKAVIGQYIARIRKVRTALYKIRAIDEFLENCPCLSITCTLNEWNTAYRKFVDYRTAMYIAQFIHTGTQPAMISDIAANLEDYVKDNFDTINQYIVTH